MQIMGLDNNYRTVTFGILSELSCVLITELVLMQLKKLG